MFLSWAPHTITISRAVPYPSAQNMRRPSGTYRLMQRVSREYPISSNQVVDILMFKFQAVRELTATREFELMSLQADEDEHSIEMHLPYVRKIFEG